MALRQIREEGDEFLRKRSREVEIDDINKSIIKEDIDSIEKNNSNKDSTCNEETNCNSCEKNGILVK